MSFPLRQRGRRVVAAGRVTRASTPLGFLWGFLRVTSPEGHRSPFCPETGELVPLTAEG